MKKINELQIRYSLMIFIFLMNFAEAKNFVDQVNNILDLISNTYMKALGGLIILAVGIYMIKEKERLKEIATSCIVIIVAVATITNARQIADWLI
ncbi:virB2 type IV secretion protein [Helicobacter cappadocius]|uniref:VirB2 type IV secretion protein n=1 Tax=Helicobacter cappadocius TaxID=3063998 RepID=A0AA90PYA0_9HELI|nr:MULTISPECIES: virB2 type IV secretion protein [unclassified Helicobacter]MDO7253086.1 virB2 type IV secretion protein [Helicobacter sp. faydin-H75]MDP2538788.1 virB2 type IV secretion protein [Helicobacter sp. faydin-H76]